MVDPYAKYTEKHTRQQIEGVKAYLSSTSPISTQYVEWGTGRPLNESYDGKLVKGHGIPGWERQNMRVSVGCRSQQTGQHADPRADVRSVVSRDGASTTRHIND